MNQREMIVTKCEGDSTLRNRVDRSLWAFVANPYPRIGVAGDFLLLGVLLAAFGCGGNAFALDPGKRITQYVHDVWQTDDGLPQNTVRSIVQTRDGYLWLATQGGLARFNGVNFTVFDKGNTPAIRNDIVTSLFEDSKQNLWIVTRPQGLLRGNGGQLIEQQSLTEYIVMVAYEDRQGDLWVGTYDDGLVRFKDGKPADIYTTKEGLAGDVVFSILEDQEGFLWIGTRSGLSRFKDGKFTNFTAKEGLSHGVVMSLCEDRQRGLWIGTYGGGVIRLKDGKFTAFTIKEGLSNNMVGRVFLDRDGNLWIGTYGGGLNRWENGRFQTYTSKEGLSSDVVLSIYEDGEGSLWVGTDGGGLNRFKDGAFSTYTTRDGLSSGMTASIYEDRERSLWIGTYGGGLNRLKDGAVTVYTRKDGLSSDTITSLFQDRLGQLWIGTEGGGLNCLRNSKFSQYALEGVSNYGVFSILEDRAGTLWVGTRSGLTRLEQNRLVRFTEDYTLCITEGHDGSLWIGTYGHGLKRLKDGKLTTYTRDDGLPTNIVFSVYEDRDAIVWIGTSGGLSRLREGRLSAYGSEAGLLDQAIYQILEDVKSNLWMSCAKGVFRASKIQLNDLAQGKTRGVTCVLYGKGDGMLSGECRGGMQPAGWKAMDGRLWFPTTKGVVVVDPTRITINQRPPPVLIEEVIVDSASAHNDEDGHPLRLPPGKEKFEFHYAALSFLAPGKVRFRYKLEGFDKEWVDAGTRRAAYYTHISPGDYRFKVIACNNDGVWNQAGATFDFSLLPHYYQTYWFYGLCAIGTAVAAGLAHRLRVSQVQARERTLASRVEEALAQIKILRGMLPICASCKKIRDDKGYWSQIEMYIQDHSEAEFSHGICPECMKRLYPDFFERKGSNGASQPPAGDQRHSSPKQHAKSE